MLSKVMGNVSMRGDAWFRLRVWSTLSTPVDNAGVHKLRLEAALFSILCEAFSKLGLQGTIDVPSSMT